MTLLHGFKQCFANLQSILSPDSLFSNSLVDSDAFFHFPQFLHWDALDELQNRLHIHEAVLFLFLKNLFLEIKKHLTVCFNMCDVGMPVFDDDF